MNTSNTTASTIPACTFTSRFFLKKKNFQIKFGKSKENTFQATLKKDKTAQNLEGNKGKVHSRMNLAQPKRIKEIQSSRLVFQVFLSSSFF